MTDYFNITMPVSEINAISSLGLAHVGDAVYELLVRTHICKTGRVTAMNMHKDAVAFVNAHAQSGFAKKLLPFLNEEESAVFMRGRNAKPGSIPKNASLDEYHSATGLEALLGYLFLLGRRDRINDLFEIIIGESW